MARQRFDIGSKWLLHNQGKGAALVGGLKEVTRCEPMPGEIVQNRRLPDGLLQAYLADDPKAHPLLIEIATYPEKRAMKQAFDDLTLAYSALGQLPDLLMLVLRPKGKFRIGDVHGIQSDMKLSSLEAKWRTVELWTLPAERFLAEADVGVLPWVPLMAIEGSPETLLERCADRIEREAQPGQRTDLLVISQVMAELHYPGLDLLNIFGGRNMIAESRFLQKVIAERIHDLILDTLKDRFGSVPRDVTKQLREIVDEKKLKRTLKVAIKCPDIEAFRAVLTS